PLVDWSESIVNFKCALGWKEPRGRAFLDGIYWSRMLGFVLAIFGAARAITLLFYIGWRHQYSEVREIGTWYWAVPVCAAAAVIVATKLSAWRAWVALVAGPAAAALGGMILFAAGWIVSTFFPEIPKSDAMMRWEGGRSLPGLLLLLQLALVYFWRAMLWTAEPMVQANLGSIVSLQWRPTPAKVKECLEHWRSQLECRWKKDDPVKGPAAVRMRELLGLVLWRDILGFIPVYSLVFLFGLWFAASQLPVFAFLNWPGGSLALWWMIPVLAAVTDYVEDICHLHFRKLHALGKLPSAAITLLSSAMSVIKFFAVWAELLLTGAAVFVGTWALRHNLTDWRAKIAVVISALAAVVLIVTLAGYIVHFFLDKKEDSESEKAPQKIAARA
ncbi:MAG TPA: hypothetical protein VIX89_00710, partial [Bryobacteraceae bacterium]